jgi:uroporphyrin-III C-methyltransferase/precorrin-2 dehydrogenase/sirohydrochlorin ferrochelatase
VRCWVIHINKERIVPLEQKKGEVYLVGAGPGDADLLTIRAYQILLQADVVLFDNLVSKAVMALIPEGVESIFVGKQRSRHTLPQEEINALLVRLAGEGKRVVRLKGGDPFIFGRGGEEIETLAEYGVSFQVVPGVTAASGVAAYAGIPLTHRDYAQSCVFVAGHLKDQTVDLDWPMLARPNQTIVVYMGLEGLATICQQLIAHGLDETTPAAVVEQGTLPDQQVLVGVLSTLASQASEAKFKSPTLVIIGGVVNLREKLRWFDAFHLAIPKDCN